MATIDTVGTSSGNNFFDFAKEKYADAVKNQCRVESPYYDLLKRTNKTADHPLGGRGFVVPMRVRRAFNFSAIAGVGAGDVTSNLPTPNVPPRVRAVVRGEDLAGRFQIGKTDMKATEGNLSAFLDIFQDNVEMLQNEAKESIGRQLIGNDAKGDGTTGVLGKVSSISGAAITLTTNTAHHFREGMRLIVDADPTPGTGSNTVTVASIDSANTITVSAAGTIAANDLIAVGSSTSGSEWGGYSKELKGLDHAIKSSGTFQGVSGTTYKAWSSHVDAPSTARPIKKRHINAIFANTKVKSGKMPDTILLHSLLLIEVATLFEDDVRYKPQTFKGGYDHELMTWHNGVNQVKFIQEDYCPTDTMYFVRLDDIGLGALYELEWMDEDGSRASRISNKNGFEFTMSAHMQQVFYRRNTLAKATNFNINTSTIAAPD